MTDNNGRSIDYLRISITDRCNLRCVYCMPDGGVPKLERREVLRYEEIVRLVDIMTKLGIRHLRLTGGEPMARKGCLELAERLHALPGVESISMTSNGLLLCDKIDALKRSGVTALNLSIDSLSPDTYARLTRGGDVRKVLDTLHQAVEAGLNVKVNAVLGRGINDHELAGLVLLAKDMPICVRFIELMPIGCARGLEPVTQDEVLTQLADRFAPLTLDDERHGHGPARYIKPAGFAGSIGLISPISHEFCASCNRVRLTADGQLKLCLNHTKGLDLRGMLRGRASDKTLEAAIREAIANKPKCHEFREETADRETRRMNEIGG